MGAKRFLVGLVAAVAVASILGACVSGGESGGLGVKDAGSQQACAGVQTITASARTMGAQQLRASLGQIYQAAMSSENALIKARALALYADATVMASGGQSPTLNDDLQEMTQACSGQG
jgi:hypothetical protein